MDGRPKQLQNRDRAPPTQVCQKCYGKGHYTYQCTKKQVYKPRPSRTQQLLKGIEPERVTVPDEFLNKEGLANKLLKQREEERAKQRAEEKKQKPKRSKRRDMSS
ncbi:hypothetical protein NCC49_000104 [Naganishia albida]|nr:hypothetical protein NCC49_000104 [Naganishia albida]